MLLTIEKNRSSEALLGTRGGVRCKTARFPRLKNIAGCGRGITPPCPYSLRSRKTFRVTKFHSMTTAVAKTFTKR